MVILERFIPVDYRAYIVPTDIYSLSHESLMNEYEAHLRMFVFDQRDEKNETQRHN